MKIVFTGNKKFEKYSELDEYASEEDLSDRYGSLPRDLYGFDSSLLWRMNGLFRDGFTIPLSGMEITLQKGGPLKKIESVAWKKQDDAEMLVTLGNDLVKVVLDYNAEDKIFEFEDGPYNFGREQFSDAVYQRFVEAVGANPEKKREFDEIKYLILRESKNKEDLEKRTKKFIRNFLMPKTKISNEHFSIFRKNSEDGESYIVDNGSYMGTWTETKILLNPPNKINKINKLGLEYESWLYHCLDQETEELFRKPKNIEINMNNGENLLKYAFFEKRNHPGPSYSLRKIINNGYSILEENETNKIILGKDITNGDYEFELKLD